LIIHTVQKFVGKLEKIFYFEQLVDLSINLLSRPWLDIHVVKKLLHDFDDVEGLVSYNESNFKLDLRQQ